MAVAYELRFEGATLEQYDRVIELMEYTDGVADAEGAIFHWIAKTDDGIVVVDVWETDEHFNRFSEEKIGPLTRQAGFPGAPVVTRHEVHNTLAPAGAAAHA
jgi:hypothetical protein